MPRAATNLDDLVKTRFPESYHMELIDGVEVEKPLPKNLHAFVQSYLLVFLTQMLPRPYRVASELNVLCGKDRLVPDITVMKRDAHYEDGDLADPPLLAIEIMSPAQTFSNIRGKCERLIAAGAGTCWLLWPERREAWTFTAEAGLVLARSALAADLPDYRVTVALTAIWAELE